MVITKYVNRGGGAVSIANWVYLLPDQALVNIVRRVGIISTVSWE